MTAGTVVQDRPGLRVAMAVFGDITYDSRVQREAETVAAAGHHVVLACLPGSTRSAWSPPGVTILPLDPGPGAILPGAAPPARPARRRRAIASIDRLVWLWRYVASLRGWGGQVAAAVGAADVWHAHDLAAMTAVSPRVDPGTPIVYDSHELFLDTGGAAHLPGPLRALIRRHERRQVARAAALVTVNQELARILGRRYRPRRTVVVHNCPPRSVPYAGPDLLREAARIGPGTPIVLHHGMLAENRGLETLVAAMLEPGLEEAHLVLLGLGPLRASLRERATDPAYRGRVHVLDAVPAGRVLDWISSADVGAIALPTTDLNLRSATPNKLFECLAAGVPVVVSDLAAVRRIVDDPGGPLGAVADPESPPSVAAAIRSLLDPASAERRAVRDRCRSAAARRWNWERESAGLVDLYASLDGRAALPVPPELP